MKETTIVSCSVRFFNLIPGAVTPGKVEGNIPVIQSCGDSQLEDVIVFGKKRWNL